MNEKESNHKVEDRPSIGSYLRKLREQKNLSVEDVSFTIKVPQEHIIEIENDIFDHLGGLGFARAIIVSYTRFLEGNENRVLKMFDKGDNTVRRNLVKDFSYKDPSPRKLLLPGNVFSILMLIILVIVLGSISYSFYKKGLISLPFKKDSIEQSEEKTTSNKPKISFFKKDNKDKKDENEKKDKINPNITTKQVILDSLNDKKEDKEDSPISEFVLKDTTDYVHLLLFKKKNNPLNYRE